MPFVTGEEKKPRKKSRRAGEASNLGPLAPQETTLTTPFFIFIAGQTKLEVVYVTLAIHANTVDT